MFTALPTAVRSRSEHRRLRSRHVVIGAALLGGAALLTTTLGGGSEDARDGGVASFARVRPAAVLPGEPVPAPIGEPVLEIHGRIGATNVGDALVFDMDTLEDLGLVQARIREPFGERESNYVGVDLATLLEVAQVDEAASELRLTALDDYAVTLSVADMHAGGILLATRSDGRRMAVDQGGPTRIVFLDGVEAGANPDQWIWSVASVEAR